MNIKRLKELEELSHDLYSELQEFRDELLETDFPEGSPEDTFYMEFNKTVALMGAVWSDLELFVEQSE
jgi:RNA binding exosome subunit